MPTAMSPICSVSRDAVDYPAQEIATELVGAEGVGRARGGEPAPGPHMERVVRSDDGRQHGAED